MPRKARLCPPACFFHVMSRGIEGRDIFGTDDDRERFLQLLSTGLRRTGYACYAWSLMRNHYHLVLRSSELHLCQLMRPLNAAYAQHFSRVHNRRGYLFQDRYKSIVTQDQRYVEEMIRYVHTNPLRAGVCATLKELDRYAWTGHAVLMGTVDADFQDTWPVLRRFGATIEKGRKGYSAFIAAGSEMSEEFLASIRKGNTDHDRSAPGAYVIGDREFVKQVLDADRERRVRIARRRLERLSIEEVASKFASAAGIQPQDLLLRGRANRRSSLRKLFAYICNHFYGFSFVDVAAFLGCSHSPTTLAARQGAKLANDPEFAAILAALCRDPA